jgi:hypothetical protein
MARSTLVSLTALLVTIGLSHPPAAAQPYMKVHTDHAVSSLGVCSAATAGPAQSPAAATGLTTLAYSGQVLEDGGTLNPIAFINPAVINQSGTIAFFSQVDGVDRNQGIFVADTSGARTLVRGCGAGGGSNNAGTACGDRAPGGGTFSGFYGGTFFAPAINDDGDVLFFADVFRGGVTTRGLFLYQAAAKKIVKVARTGDFSARLGRLTAIGPGSLNNNGDVVFLAQGARPDPSSINILRWRDGMLHKVAVVGDRAPGGGSFSTLGTETLTFASGVTIPVGPVPGINDRGQISFRAYVSGGVTQQGLIVSTNGVNQWYVRAGDATPAGGTYVDFWAPVLNNSGELAFVADYAPAPDTVSAAWFAGSPRGGWRKALAICDPVDGGVCIGLAVSRNPMRPLNDGGDLMVWSDVQTPAGDVLQKLIVSAADGTLSTIVTQGDATPLGGQIGSIQSWPSLSDGKGTVSAGTPGASNGVVTSHMVSGDN